LKAGTPQESVLVPLLFLLFLSDIADDIQSLVRLFADDSSLMFSSTYPLEVEARLNKFNCLVKLVVSFLKYKLCASVIIFC
jgi:hypothetical protein